MKSNKLIDIHRIHIPFCRLDNARITMGNQLVQYLLTDSTGSKTNQQFLCLLIIYSQTIVFLFRNMEILLIQNQTQHHSEKIKDSYLCLISNITLNLASQQLDQSKDPYLCLGTP